VGTPYVKREAFVQVLNSSFRPMLSLLRRCPLRIEPYAIVIAPD